MFKYNYSMNLQKFVKNKNLRGGEEVLPTNKGPGSEIS